MWGGDTNKCGTRSLIYRGIWFSRDQLSKSPREYRLKSKMSKADETWFRTMDKIRDKHECFKVDSYEWLLGEEQTWPEESWSQESNEKWGGMLNVGLCISRLVLCGNGKKHKHTLILFSTRHYAQQVTYISSCEVIIS